ncbi:MAG: putative rane protein [Herbinix sp.]|nr:putative rane protein [Herbinix sp.]
MIYLKRSAGRIFLRGFILSIFIVIVLLSAGILGYRLTLQWWQPEKQESEYAFQGETLPDTENEVDPEEPTTNLIFCYDKETGKITRTVLEILNSKTECITYITIPMRTEIKLSDVLYRKMTLANPDMPQFLQLTAISSYFNMDNVFENGVAIIEELLNSKINYYTAIPKEKYEKIFYSKNQKTEKNKEQSEYVDQQQKIESFTATYIKELKKMKTEEDLRIYLEEIYPSLTSNLSLSDKLKYIDFYSKITLNNISFELVSGENTNLSFKLDQSAMKARVDELIK